MADLGSLTTQRSEKRDRGKARKEPYYYQRIAIDTAIQCFVKGQRRILLTMAIGCILRVSGSFL